jgi:hypothetical protein
MRHYGEKSKLVPGQGIEPCYQRDMTPVMSVLTVNLPRRISRVLYAEGRGFEPRGPVSRAGAFQEHCNQPDSANLPLFFPSFRAVYVYLIAITGQSVEYGKREPRTTHRYEFAGIFDVVFEADLIAYSENFQFIYDINLISHGISFHDIIYIKPQRETCQPLLITLSNCFITVAASSISCSA